MEKLKQYDLEERTLQFFRQVIAFVNVHPRTQGNIEIGKQVIRFAGSVGANYIEANEALSKKDFLMRIRLCRKEAKESRYRLMLVETGSEEQTKKLEYLIDKTDQLMKILAAILLKIA